MNRDPDNIYRNIPNRPESHGWAFYYYLKNQNDCVVSVEKSGDKHDPITVKVWEQTP